MTARSEVLQRLREALGHDRPAVRSVPRLYRAAGSLTHGSRPLIDMFLERVVDYGATATVARPELIPGEIAALVPPGTVVVPQGLDPELVRMLCEGVVRIDGDPTLLENSVLDSAACVISTARLGIAETGSIVLDHGPGQGRRALTLLPDRHICVLSAKWIVETVPEAIRLLDSQRTLTLVSGPSATSDIELQRVQGVHGPRHLHVLVAAECSEPATRR